MKTNELSVNEIYVFKLNSGEEVVARVTTVDAAQLGLSKPVTIMLGQGGAQMMPSFFTAHPDHEMWLNTTAIAMIATPRQDVENSYIEATTGIKPVGNKILMG